MSVTPRVHNVLLVEDDIFLLGCASEYLTARGFVVTPVGDLSFALSLLSERSYDGVITDLHLTGTGRPDGLNVVAAAARVRPRPAIVIWTGSPLDEFLERGSGHGADALLQKGTLSELAHVLGGLLHLAGGTARLGAV